MYSSKVQTCQTKIANIGVPMSKVIYDSKTYGTSTGNEQLLQTYVATAGPISVCLYVSTKFFAYRSGNF